MSSGMNTEQAKEYAKTMTYSQAVANISHGKGVLYKKATMIKLRELAEIADRLDRFLVTELTESEYADAYNRGFASAVAMMADRKTEPNSSEIPNNSTISKMEQVDKDINVRSKDEPQMGDAKPIPLSNRVTHIKDEPQTDCAWRRDDG